MNIRFEYLYRDAGNFKKWGEIIFSNPNNIDIELVESMAKKVLIDESYFVANKANIPDLHFEHYNEQLDHGWHEMHTFQSTNETPNDQHQRTIDEFFHSLQEASAL